MQSFQKQMFNAFFETLLEQLCRRRECKLAGCRFAFGTDVGETECCNGDVGVVGSRDLASNHDFFFRGELAVWLYAASVNADVAETSAGFLVTAGMERDSVIVAFPPKGRTVCDVAVVGGEGCVNGGESQRDFTGSFALLRMTHGCRTALVSRLSSLDFRFAQVPTVRLGHAQLRWSRLSPYTVVV